MEVNEGEEEAGRVVRIEAHREQPNNVRQPEERQPAISQIYVRSIIDLFEVKI